MPVLTIPANYDGEVTNIVGIGKLKDDTATFIRIGLNVIGVLQYMRRGFLRFPLTALPSGSTVTQVRLYVYCRVAGAATHLLDIHGYGYPYGTGQGNPETDNASYDVLWVSCAGGSPPSGPSPPYVNDSTLLRTTGDKWFTLGAVACTDVQNAKAAVNRFAIGLEEEGDNANPPAEIDTLETVGGFVAQLEITYTAPRRNIGLHPSKIVPLIASE